jgi:hypothetical protein
MTVKELKEIIKDIPDEAEVLQYDNEYMSLYSIHRVEYNNNVLSNDGTYDSTPTLDLFADQTDPTKNALLLF